MKLEHTTSRRLSLLGVAVWLALLTLPVAASAEDWMFRRSYFSHALPPEVAAQYPRPESRSAYRPAVVSYGPGFAIRGGTRINRIFMRSGQSTDLTIIRQDWFDVRP
jgi:hypothetical protein